MNEQAALQPRRPAEPRTDYVRLITEARTDAEMIDLAAQCILQEFEAYYRESRHIPELAKQAFERRDAMRSLSLSRRRLSIYGESIALLASQLERVFPLLAWDEGLWRKMEARYRPMIEGRYEDDLGLAFIQSVRRKIFQDEWQRVEYSFGERAQITPEQAATILRAFPGGAQVTPGLAAAILEIPDFATPYADPDGDARRIAARLNAALGLDGSDADAIRAVEMADAGFYRNRGAYLVGRAVSGAGARHPIAIALLNGDGGIHADAVLTGEADLHNLFSSTLANFHVTNTHYHELAAFLHDLMPRRPLGLHYSTIGFNHVGKVAVMDEMRDELHATGEVFDTAVGFRGTVAIAFSTPSSNYTLKVIRDRPTDQYKWGEFEGVATVLNKYRRVHEINRTGSMLDNIVYSNIRLERDWFEPALLDELVREAGGTVHLRNRWVTFDHLIVQMKMIPLPVFFETASAEDAERVVVSLGHCIKNNAAANVFNKDLDARNYGVGRYLKVYLFDYDAVEPFTHVKLRTNADRFDGEEDVPEWVFEEGYVFLPEEMEVGLRLPTRALRRRFHEVHGDLSTLAYWESLQHDLLGGHVPAISTYPDDRRLSRD